MNSPESIEDVSMSPELIAVRIPQTPDSAPIVRARKTPIFTGRAVDAFSPFSEPLMSLPSRIVEEPYESRFKCVEVSPAMSPEESYSALPTADVEMWGESESYAA